MFNKIIKTHISNVPFNNFEEIKLSYLDFSITGEVEVIDYNKPMTRTLDNHLENMSTKSIMVKQLTFTKKDVKTINYFNLYNVILNKYYELYLKNDDFIKEKNTIDFNIDFNAGTNYAGNIKFMQKVSMLSNYIANKSRLGPANVAIIPDKKYEFLFPHNQIKTIINPTNNYKDKIFIIKVDKDDNGIGLVLILDKDLYNMRYYKLQKLLSKIKDTKENNDISYILTEIGDSSYKKIQVISL